VAGIFLGTALSARIHGYKLKKGFSWFIKLRENTNFIKKVFL
jgi:hypothetical protein